ncbi:MAG: archaeosortase/exosortase family protein [Candidatus Diapherotrites archaeon]|nr:archaeosortase/exosortase family protein [Candidatus Diapherotrites archaeon]
MKKKKQTKKRTKTFKTGRSKGTAKKTIKKAQKSEKESFKIAVFLAKFFLLFAFFSYAIEKINLSALNTYIAGITAAIAALPFSGNEIIIPNGEKFIITNLCTGLLSGSILFSIIFSLKRPAMKKKIITFLAGLAVLLLANIPRISIVLVAAKSGFDAELVHTTSWFLMSGLVVLLWYYGTKKIAGIKNFNELI